MWSPSMVLLQILKTLQFPMTWGQWGGGGEAQREAKGHDIDLGVILYGFELKLGLWNRKVRIETENTLKNQ